MNITYKKGDIIFVKNEGYQAVIGIQSGNRPYLVVSNNVFNQYSPVLNCVPLTTKTAKKSPVHLILDKNVGLPHDSVVLCEQLQIISKSSITNVICTLPNKLIEQINKLIEFQLAL